MANHRGRFLPAAVVVAATPLAQVSLLPVVPVFAAPVHALVLAVPSMAFVVETPAEAVAILVVAAVLPAAVVATRQCQAGYSAVLPAAVEATHQPLAEDFVFAVAVVSAVVPAILAAFAPFALAQVVANH